MDNIISQEHRKRLLLIQQQKDAWPQVTKNAVAEARVAKELETARLKVKEAEDTERRVREGLYQTMMTEEAQRSALWDEQLQAWMAVAQEKVASAEDAVQRASNREDEEKSQVLQFWVAESRERLDLKGLEEQEGYNILYKEQRERHRLLEALQMREAVEVLRVLRRGEQHSTVQYSTAGHGTAPNSTARHGRARHSTAQHSTAQHSTAQHSTALRSTTWDSTPHHTTPHHTTPHHTTPHHTTPHHTTPHHTTPHHTTPHHTTPHHTTPHHTTPHHTTPHHTTLHQSARCT